jgi:hypothetical protein
MESRLAQTESQYGKLYIKRENVNIVPEDEQLRAPKCDYRPT